MECEKEFMNYNIQELIYESYETETFLKTFLQNLTASEFDTRYFADKIKLLCEFKTKETNKISNEIILAIAILLKSVSLFGTREVLSLIQKIFIIDANKVENNLKNNKKILSGMIQTNLEKNNVFLDIPTQIQIKDRSLFRLSCYFFLNLFEKFLNNKIIFDYEEIKKLKIVLVTFMFFPSYELIDSSLEFVTQIVELNFKYALSKIENKSEWNSVFFELLKKDFLEDLMIWDATSKISEDKLSNTEIKKIIFKNIFPSRSSLDEIFYVRDSMILFFVFNYKVNFSLIRDKYIALNITGDSNSLKHYEEFFKTISYFQENFIGNFFLSDMMAYIKQAYTKSYSVMIPKLENVLVNYQANISKLFNYSLNSSLSLRADLVGKYDCIESSTCLTPYISKEKFINGIVTTFTRSDSSGKSSIIMHSCDYLKWRKLFDKNPLLTATVSIQTLNNTLDAKGIMQLNYNDIYSAVSSLLESKLENNDCIHLFKILIKSLCIVYIMFNNDINSYSFLLNNKGNESEIYENVLKYNTNIILLIWKIKLFLGKYYSYIQEEAEKLINDIISSREESILYIYFEEDMIKYILENIESSHICSKYIDDFVNSKIPYRVLNGILLLGHWACVYPLKYIYTRTLDILFILRKNVNLRDVLTTEDNVNKLCKGIYLLYKAFPKLHEEFSSFLNYLKTNIVNCTSSYELKNYTSRMLDRLSYYTERVLIGSEYTNENILHVELLKEN